MEPQCHIPRPRPEVSRSKTWPSPSPLVVKLDTKQPDLFDIDEHPEAHFLSPTQMYDDYDDWSSDSDDDTDEVEWNAGITDFALFDQDRRQASASGQAIPGKWDTMLSSQASALGRAVKRSRHEDLSRTPSTDSMPDLTPDSSPHLRDDLDLTSIQARPIVPAYLKSIRTPHDEKADLSHYVQHRRVKSSPNIFSKRPVRPGLRDGRTLSGKEHVWRRPGWDIFTVREDPAAELRAEKASTSSQQQAQ